MSDIHFEPWVGNDYWNGGCFGKRILILGESHYGEDKGPSMTKDIIYDQANSNYTMPAYTNFERALEGDTTGDAERKRIWESVAFYNYVQVCLPKARISPTAEEFAVSEAAFFELLEQLKPEIVLVWGTRLWENLPYSHYAADKDCEYEGYKYRCGSYTTDSGTIAACYEIQHPSSGFSWSWWYNFLVQNGIL